MSDQYHDRWIDCNADGLTIRGYYFPLGSKRILYGSIRRVSVVKLTAMRGKWRIWGTSNPRYWASLDPGRSGKEIGLVLDLGARVMPLITPDDPERVLSCIRANSVDEVREDADSTGPIV